ncbi:MAG: HAMP domain-containing histidine kinase [Candidatus Nomurabacteria bacterium]|jgi:signal transduction histidine kinase|nr:HAMP domain-containing histidine kinase [Candidatus Nomurabacteria bacterium]
MRRLESKEVSADPTPTAGQRYRRSVVKLTILYSLTIYVICGISTGVAILFNRVATSQSTISVGVASMFLIWDVIFAVPGVIISYFLAKHFVKPLREDSILQRNFVSNAAHQLRHPIANLRLRDELALRNPAGNKAAYQAVVRTNLSDLDEMSTMLNNLLALTLNEKIPLEICSIHQKIDEWYGRDKRIINDVAPGDQIKCAPTVLKEVLAILIDNAFKYGATKVQLRSDKNRLLHITDNGDGIDPDDLPHIFEQFYRGHKSGDSAGYGLGLPLAKHMLERADAWIKVKSWPGRGTTFTIGSSNRAVYPAKSASASAKLKTLPAKNPLAAAQTVAAKTLKNPAKKTLLNSAPAGKTVAAETTQAKSNLAIQRALPKNNSRVK